MTEEIEGRKRSAILNSLANLTKRVIALEAKVNRREQVNGWGEWAQKLIIALLTALLLVLGYEELVALFA